MFAVHTRYLCATMPNDLFVQMCTDQKPSHTHFRQVRHTTFAASLYGDVHLVFGLTCATNSTVMSRLVQKAATNKHLWELRTIHFVAGSSEASLVHRQCLPEVSHQVIVSCRLIELLLSFSQHIHTFKLSPSRNWNSFPNVPICFR